ncbi:hypothetical protein [Bradyrhizobium sp. URHD0069]|uniref:hypothetical protein n=1 Tax=Bradyrhizobium sp. URHD0069 TaxID=1380355 RepID=UPI0005655195|nr:hypothetical protein [Bradyrhizobium sp. URHD0069]
MNVAQRRKNRGALFIIAPLVIALAAIWIIYDPFRLISNPEPAEGGFTHTPAWLWLIGVGILGLMLTYGISRSRNRSRAEENMTQEATKDLYRREEKDRERKDLLP